jgi:hypothetical protein
MLIDMSTTPRKFCFDRHPINIVFNQPVLAADVFPADELVAE